MGITISETIASLKNQRILTGITRGLVAAGRSLTKEELDAGIERRWRYAEEIRRKAGSASL